MKPGAAITAALQEQALVDWPRVVRGRNWYQPRPPLKGRVYRKRWTRRKYLGFTFDFKCADYSSARPVTLIKTSDVSYFTQRYTQ